VVHLVDDDSRWWRRMHKHPILPLPSNSMCNHNGPRCRRIGTSHACASCNWNVCIACVEGEKKRHAENEKEKARLRAALDGEREGTERGETHDVAELISALAKVAELDDGEQSGDDDAGVSEERTADHDDDDMQKAKFEAAKKAAVEASRVAILGGSTGGPGGSNLPFDPGFANLLGQEEGSDEEDY